MSKKSFEGYVLRSCDTGDIYIGEEGEAWADCSMSHLANVWSTKQFDTIASEVWDLTGRDEYCENYPDMKMNDRYELFKDELLASSYLINGWKTGIGSLSLGKQAIAFVD